MKRSLIAIGIAIVVIVVITGSLLAARGHRAPSTTTTVPPVVETSSVVADGTVQPVTRAELSFPLAGRVVEVAVKEGDAVTPGQTLVKLDDTAAGAVVAAAEASTAAAQAAVDQSKAAADAAQAAVDAAQANRDGVPDGAASWRIDATDAAVAQAKAQLQAAQADVSAATARLAAAQANTKQAQAVLDDLAIIAPFSGTVAEVAVKVGDQVGPSTVAVRLADLSAWEIVTTDLDEASIASVKVGAAVQLTFDALPEITATGRVTEVALVGQPYQGTMVFPVTVVPDGPIQGLRWGLTATAEIDTGASAP
jgi:multidrug efflux pump subunit AcrA (membrane-fusion protein)